MQRKIKVIIKFTKKKKSMRRRTFMNLWWTSFHLTLALSIPNQDLEVRGQSPKNPSIHGCQNRKVKLIRKKDVLKMKRTILLKPKG